jgi:hypothetical protein
MPATTLIGGILFVGSKPAQPSSPNAGADDHMPSCLLRTPLDTFTARKIIIFVPHIK